MASQLLFAGGGSRTEAKRFSNSGRKREDEVPEGDGGGQILSEGANFSGSNQSLCASISRISKEKVSRIVIYALELGPGGLIYSF